MAYCHASRLALPLRAGGPQAAKLGDDNGNDAGDQEPCVGKHLFGVADEDVVEQVRNERLVKVLANRERVAFGVRGEDHGPQA